MGFTGDAKRDMTETSMATTTDLKGSVYLGPMPDNEMSSEALKIAHRTYNVVSYTPSALNAGAKRRATTSPVGAFDECRPGVARSAL